MIRITAVVFMMCVTVAAAPQQGPANDNLSAAQLVQVRSVAGNTTGATDEPGEVTAGCGATVDEPGVWFVLPQSAAKELVVIDTSGSDLDDTVLSLWVGAGHPLTEAACNDDDGDTWSRIAFMVEPATTYYVKVSGLGGSEGAFLLNSTVALAPPNDDLADAIPIDDPASFLHEQSTVGATHEPGEAVASCSLYRTEDEEASVWYTVTSPDDVEVALFTLGSDFDTVLTVWVGDSGHPLTELVCSDDVGNNLWSSVAFTAQAGIPYYVKAAGNLNTDSGNLELRAGAPPQEWTVLLPFSYVP